MKQHGLPYCVKFIFVLSCACGCTSYGRFWEANNTTVNSNSNPTTPVTITTPPPTVYNNSGVAQWVQTTAAATNSSVFNAVAVDSSGNIFAAGDQTGNVAFTYGAQSATGTFTGGGNVLLVKYNSSGVAQWAQTTAAGGNASYFNSVAVDASGNIYAAGYQTGSAAFTYGTQSATGAYLSGGNVILVKYNSSGVAQWAQTTAAGANNSGFNSVAVDASGNIYAAGYQTGNTAFTYGTQSATGAYNGINILLVKYNSSGVAQWAQTTAAGVNISTFMSVAVDSSGNIYAAGSQSGNTLYTYGTQSATGTFTGGTNVLLVKYNSTGVAQWAQTTATGPSASVFNSVAVDSSGNIYAAGSQSASTLYTYGTQSATGAFAGGVNVLLVKYNSSGVAQWAQTTATGPSASVFNSITVDSSGAVYAAGYQGNNAAFTYGTQSATGAFNGINVLLVKYNSTGMAQWAQTTAAGANSSLFNSVAADSSGSLYAVGYQTGNTGFTYGTQSATGAYNGSNVILIQCK